MYQIGDVVVYGSEGVCRVEEIGTPEISGINKQKQYYTLAPLYRDGKIFIPVDTSVFMRPAMSRDEAETLIRQLPGVPSGLDDGCSFRLLNEHYQSLIRSHDNLDIVQLIKTIYNRQQQTRGRGGKPSQIDERYMKRAEDLLYGELAYALDISREDVCSYIIQVMDGTAREA